MILAAAATLAVAAAPAVAATDRAAVRLDVPLIEQAPERCGPAALAMVLRFHGGGPAAAAAAERAYDPAFRGALLTDLAAAARRAGYRAAIETPAEDSLAAHLRRRLPPVLLYRRGFGPVSRGHYAVLVGWDPARREYTLHDGGRRPRRMGAADLMRRWRTAGGLALIVRPPE
jgi:ABC-type bacteriocin/lantibiotic exporter with double-glycine peptidase domain